MSSWSHAGREPVVATDSGGTSEPLSMERRPADKTRRPQGSGRGDLPPARGPAGGVAMGRRGRNRLEDFSLESMAARRSGSTTRRYRAEKSADNLPDLSVSPEQGDRIRLHHLMEILAKRYR